MTLLYLLHPFANASSFFVTAGFSIGGDKLLKISGHSDELKNLAAQGKEYGIEIGAYHIPVDEQAHRTTSLSLWTIYRFIQC